MKQIIIAITCSIFFLQLSAQQLLSPTSGFSKKKTSYITLNNGKQLKGLFGGMYFKKGLITDIKFKTGSGKSQKISASDIKEMYLQPSKLGKLSKSLDAIGDAQKWNDEKLNQDLLNQGYVFFESAKVRVKKKEFVALLQLLNPDFSKEVKIYHDIFAKESASIGVGPITAAGGNAKSYFVKFGNETAYKLEKKNYKKEFIPMWKKCKNVSKVYKDIKWSDLPKHIIEYSKCD